MSRKDTLTVEEYAKNLDAVANQMPIEDFGHTVEIESRSPDSERFDIRITVPVGGGQAEILLKDSSRMPPAPSIEAAVRATWVSHQVHAYASGEQRDVAFNWKPLFRNKWNGAKIAHVRDESPKGESKLKRWKPKFAVSFKDRSADVGFASRYVSLRASKPKDA